MPGEVQPEARKARIGPRQGGDLRRPSEIPPSIAPPIGSDVSQVGVDDEDRDSSIYRWVYRWDAASPEESEPPLWGRILSEIQVAMLATAEPPLIFVRGELGIGKTTLAKILRRALNRAANEASDPQLANRLRLCRVLEAGDLETPQEFAIRVNRDAESHAVVALARPVTLTNASLSLNRVPRASATMLPFASDTPLFDECIDVVANVVGLASSLRGAHRRICARLPEIFETPFYFQVLANALAGSRGVDLSDMTSLDLLAMAVETALGRDVPFDQLVEIAMARHLNPEFPLTTVQGIIVDNVFVHDGYRNVVLAAGVVRRSITIEQLAECNNTLHALRLLLDHIARTRALVGSTLLSDLEEFASALDERKSRISYIVFVQALIAVALRRLGRPTAANAVLERAMALIDELKQNATAGTPGKLLQSLDAPELWWDVSDALAELSDPRLMRSVARAFNRDSGYFTYIERQQVTIGSEEIPARSDNAKPVLPFHKQEVTIGPMWVANFLVTNEQFLEFWRDETNAEFYRGSGLQWVNDDRAFLAQVEECFRIASDRNFWKERREEAARRTKGGRAALDVARERALRRNRVALWDPAQSDRRYSAPGKPVAGVTWWSAIAFSEWWRVRKLPLSDLPRESAVSLITDWEWEAVRRIFYETTATDHARSLVRDRTFPAHLRRADDGSRSLGRSDVNESLHVGLFPTPSGSGPFDMIGNVWEWTRSRVYGQIVEAKGNDATVDPVFGPTQWDDIDPVAERVAIERGRDTIDDQNDLSYRAVRGASFFSSDEEAAWNPAYRLCDPPFCSYPDLGFRVTVYPEGLGNAPRKA